MIRRHAAPQAPDSSQHVGATSVHTGPNASSRGAYLDSLALRSAIAGDQLVLEMSPAQGIALHRVIDCRAHLIGWFADSAEAWRAVDSIDTAALDGPPPDDR